MSILDKGLFEVVAFGSVSVCGEGGGGGGGGEGGANRAFTVRASLNHSASRTRVGRTCSHRMLPTVARSTKCADKI